MTRYLLDSTFVIDHLRSMPDAVARLEAMYASGDDPIVSSITTAEVWAGSGGTADAALAAFLEFIEYVHAGPPTARLAGEWRADARRRGRHLEVTDALIAATAHHLDATVLTRNVRDFELTPVRIETY